MTDFAEAIRLMVREEVERALAAKPSPAPDFVTVAEYARRRSISESTVRAAVREGRLPAERIGRAVRVPADVRIAPANARAVAAVTRDIRSARILGLGGRR